MGATLIKCSAASLLNKYVGGSQQKIRALFEIAKEFKKAVIFIDEVSQNYASYHINSFNNPLRVIYFSGLRTAQSLILL